MGNKPPYHCVIYVTNMRFMNPNMKFNSQLEEVFF